jgi:YD repeat-containing protein
MRRRTLVTDAGGGRTIHHLDGLGYTSRITHPDGREEWFYRDERKNVIRHPHPDGTSDALRWSEDDQAHPNLCGLQSWNIYGIL